MEHVIVFLVSAAQRPSIRGLAQVGCVNADLQRTKEDKGVWTVDWFQASVVTLVSRDSAPAWWAKAWQ